MNIFEGLKKYAVQSKIGQLLYDANGNSYLYHEGDKTMNEITVYPIDKLNRYKVTKLITKSIILEEKNTTKESVFDKYKLYSVQTRYKKANGKIESRLRYGFINDKGYAITHATYDSVDGILGDYALVTLQGQQCKIDTKGHPILNNEPFDKAEFVFVDKLSFTICCTEGKFGLINKFHYLCVPCEYDSIVLKKDPYGDISYAVMEKDGKYYSAIFKGDSVCNIIDFTPKSIELRKNFLVIEEEFTKDENTYTKLGLLNRGGIRILNSEYDSIEIVASNIGIVSKDGYKQLLLIGERGFQVYINNCNDIRYGESYDEERQEKYSYASVDERDFVFIEYEDQEGLHSMENNVFRPEDALEYDGAYFVFDGESNDYIAIVVGDKTKLVDLYGKEIIPLVIPSDCRVLTNTYSEGIVGISKIVKIKNTNGNIYEERRFSYIDTEGKILTDFIYDGIEKFENGQAEAYYYYPSGGRMRHVIDRNGNTINRYDECIEGEPQESNWEEWRDDAFEGDSEAYWNID